LVELMLFTKSNGVILLSALHNHFGRLIKEVCTFLTDLKRDLSVIGV